MGQYYKICNLDAKQFLHPHKLDDGLKLVEFGCSGFGTLSALALLIAKGADYEGPWAGQRLVVAGDYADEGRWVPETHRAQNLYRYADGGADDEHAVQFTEVSALARNLGVAPLGTKHPFVTGSRSAPGALKLKGDEGTFESFEELAASLGVGFYENLSIMFDEILCVLRVSNVRSSVAWGHTVEKVTLRESGDGECIIEVTVEYRTYDEILAATKVRRNLAFPATPAEVREFFK
jgi:hypothetical protein